MGNGGPRVTEESSATGSKKDYSFGQVAIRENICSFEQVKECLDIQSKLRGLGVEPKKLGDILVEKGYMTPDQVAHIAKLQAQTAQGGGKLAIPGYEMISKIGQGAMGSVYKAKQLSMDRVVAVKVLAGRYSKDRSFVERFLREARAVAKLNHENVISGIDVGEIAGLHYFVMEFVDGAPVTSIMRKEPRIPEKRCLEIGLHVARALSHAHKHGIVHRDVKPENIMITSTGVAKLCDLGLAKQTKGDTGATMDGQSVGTPNYISPEQARGEENIDIRSDIYSLGCSLYHMATGTTPFDGPNPMVVMTKHVTEWAEPPKKRHPGLSEAFNALVVKMMQKRREDRPQDPEALIAEMEVVLRGGALPAPPSTRVPPPPTSRVVDAPARRPITTSRPAPKSSSAPIVVGATVAVVVVGALLVMNVVGKGGPSETVYRPPPKDVTPPPRNPDPASENPAEAVKNEIAQFRGVAMPPIESDSRPDRYTWPYSTLTKRVEEAKRTTNLVALKAWQDEMERFVKAADEAVAKHSKWEEIKKAAKAHSDAARYAQALEEVAKLKEVYRWFSETVPTAAGKEAAEMTAKLKADIRNVFATTMQQAEAQFANPGARDEAYGTLDSLLVSGDPARKSDVEAARARFFGEELRQIVGDEPSPEKVARASARIEALKKLHRDQPGAIALLDRLNTGLKSAEKTANTAALTKAVEALAAFRPKFEAAFKARDLGAARRALSELCLPKEAAIQSALLPAPGLDLVVLRNFLDHARVSPPDAKKIVAMAEEGLAFTTKYPNDPAREAYLSLRAAALVEDLCEMALEGAKVQARDAAKFKTGFSPALQTAFVAEAPRLRKPGELSLEVASTSSSPRVPVLLSPKGAPTATLTDDDIVALAKRAPSAANDPHFPLKAFLLYHAADNLRGAKGWYDKLSTPELKAGFENLASKFAGVLSEAAEGEAEALYKDAWDTYHKKKDVVGGKKKFLDCVEKYGLTDFMRKPLPSLGKSRVEIVEAQFKSDGKQGGGGRKSVKELFGTSDVKELGRNRYEVVYQFKDDAEVAAFFAAEGAPAATRNDMGLSLSGSGQWCWKPPLKGNASIEVSFRAGGEQAFGLVVHGTSNQAGYAGVCDLPIAGQSIDALLRFPLAQGPAAMLALAPSNLAVVRGPNTASMTREGSRVRFTLNRVNIEGDNGQFQNGHVGIAPGTQPIFIDRVRVIGEVDAAWLDAPK